MLSPNNRIVLLPQDREIMDITGMSEEQYRWFVKQTILHSKLQPGEPVAFFSVVASLVIGIALSVAGALLAPRPPQQEKPRQEKRVGGQDFVSGQRSAPTSGFDSVQNVVELGSTVPLVYANRRIASDGNYYGGVRVNTNLLWSQLLSVGSGQLLRSIFLVSEGVIGELDPEQFAIGNNLIRNFDLQPSDSSRISLYYVNGSESGTNRIKSSDNIAGRFPASDLGNAENNGGADVFQARRPGVNQWAPDFVFSSTPSNQTTFGVSGFVGNNMPFKLSPEIKPTENYDNIPQKQDSQAKSDRERDVWRYYGRAGVHEINGVATTEGIADLNVGDLVRYSIFKESDFEGEFQFQVSGADGFTSTANVATSVASRQKGYDDQIALGDKYLLGTAQAVCVERSPNAFQSEVDNIPVGGGEDVSAVFEVTKAGQINTWVEAELNPPLGDIPNDQGGNFTGNQYPALFDKNVTATRTSHIMRLAEGFFSTERKTRYVEIGLRSTINLQLNGLCFFRNVEKNGDVRRLNTIDTDKVDKNVTYVNDRITTPEQRLSAFRVGYRKSSETDFTVFPFIFCIRSQKQDPVYNYLRFEFADEDIYEFKLTPVSGYELRQSLEPIQLLDYKSENRLVVTDNGVNVIFTGQSNFLRTEGNFSIAALTTVDGDPIGDDSGLGVQFDDDFPGGQSYFADAFSRVAEFFMFEEIQASITQPEHQIVYINTQTANSEVPTYANLALVGVNIRSSTEINQLQQFSVYVNQGIGSTNQFPKVLFDLLTNQRYGTGSILNLEQIDQASFDAAADFCESRFYFFDGIIDEKLNIRSWAAQTAQSFLLDFVIRNGKFALQPAVNLDGPETIRGLFTAGNIIEDTFELSFADEQDRIPPRVQVRWREEKPDQDKGLFPLIRQVTVREAGTPEDAPLEQIDASAFATSQKHAIDVAKFICRTKRLVTHSVSFTTTPTENVLDIGSVFKLGLETVNFEQPQNGAITATGEVTAWPPLADGSYPVLLWDGNSLQETTLTITDGKASPRSAVFCLRNTTATTQTYKTQSLSFDEDGNIQVQATFFPTNEAGISLIAEGFDSNSVTDWIIEGAI